MLSRVADALYWMARYVERAEHTARVLEVERRLQIDLDAIDPRSASVHRARTLAILGLPEDVGFEEALLDSGLDSTVAASLSRARENARQVREVISSEMWDYLNQAYWVLEDAARLRRRGELVSDLFGRVMRESFLWSGVADATMGRGPGWLFIRMGQFVERADTSARIVGAQWSELAAGGASQPQTDRDNFALLTMLRTCGALEEYRKRFPMRLDPKQIGAFLVLDRTYPRTVGYALMVAAQFCERLREVAPERGYRVMRGFGKLAARVQYTEADELLTIGPGPYLQDVVDELRAAATELASAYFS
ncbi:MAG: alpha-E domain-containing protein [Myxococcales bacterium]|nr:alpha-E domain-containing protein [Myxococcales bacterium]